MAERRIGKTSVVKKMRAEPPGRLVTLYRDVEGANSPADFAEKVYQQVVGHLSARKKTAYGVSSLFKELAGVELGGVIKLPERVAPHWKTLLEKAVEDLAESQDSKVVFFWDELPLMLLNIRRTSGPTVAMELLDTLRGIRQMQGGVRMVFTGSIGMHHVTTALREAGHANDTTNDMLTREVPPLEPDDAATLARELLNGEGLRCRDLQQTCSTIGSTVDRMPYFIHHIVSRMKDLGDAADGELAETIVSEALVDPLGPLAP